MNEQYNVQRIYEALCGLCLLVCS